MPRLVVTARGDIADLEGAEKYEASAFECLYVTRRTGTYLLRTLDDEGDYYREVSEEDAVIWLVENDFEVPPDVLDGLEIL